jgi:hypothetical protein
VGCLPRVAGALLALLLVAAPVAAQDWRHPRASRYAAAMAELAPLNTGISEAVADLGEGVGQLAYHAAFPPDLEAVATDAANVEADLDALQSLAADGLAVLDRYVPEDCWADLWAVSRTAYLLFGDAVAAIRTSDHAQVGSRMSAAVHLHTTYGDLVASVTTC